MSNTVIVAAAGSGKTTSLVKRALAISDGCVLITTYTLANESEIKKKFFEINGFIPPNIQVQTWFSFLLRHGVKPYQSVIWEGQIRGLILVNEKSGYIERNGKRIYFAEKDVEKYYFDSSKRIYSDKLSKFVVKANEISSGLVLKRLENIFKYIFIDEVQDMAGYDLDIIKLLFKSRINVLLVGDPRQVVYNTHLETRYRKYLNGKILEFVSNECSRLGVKIDSESLNYTYRNNEAICCFANSIYPELPPCRSLKSCKTGHDGVFFVSKKDVISYLKKYHPMQLRESKKVVVNEDYSVINFGNSKGLTYDRVLIYPTKGILAWVLDKNNEMKQQTRAKFYVAVTRARYSVAIVVDDADKLAVDGIGKYFG